MSKNKKINQLEVLNNINDEDGSNRKELMTFDAFFQKLLIEGRVYLHHKAPMRLYAKKNGLNGDATLEQFEAVFRNY
jgi:hypothetical protein